MGFALYPPDLDGRKDTLNAQPVKRDALFGKDERWISGGEAKDKYECNAQRAGPSR